MATRLGMAKNWKDSAGIVMVSGAFKYARPPTPLTSVAVGGDNPLIVPTDDLGGGDKEWETLLVKRNSKTVFFANTYVFPGGRLDASDYSPRWRQLYQQCTAPTHDPYHPILSLRNPNSPRLPIYREVPEGPIVGEVAFRICAIREMFEEAGVLLVRDRDQVAQIVDCLPGTFPSAVKAIPASTRSRWRKEVHNSGEEFLNLCSELQCVPDIWSLVQWSNWLSPRNLRVRYDTVFYLCFSEDQQAVQGDGEEIVDAKWLAPSEALRLSTEKELKLSPPQLSELVQLKSLGSAPCLHSYALRDMLQGSHYRKLSFRILTKDQIVLLVMNHDDLYPSQESVHAPTGVSLSPHLPLSPALHHVQLVPSESPTLEFTCPTHTAQELRELSNRIVRGEFSVKTGKMAFFDNGWVDVVSKHLREYSKTRDELNQAISKL